MKKVLIISYFFPPCNLTAANRVSSWQEYLPENGVYPIVITRNWSGEETDDYQRLKNTDKKIVHQKNSNSEIYFLPYKSSYRDIAFIKGQTNFLFRILSKILTLLTLFLQNISIYFIPYKNIYDKANELLKHQKDIKTVIISANPFEQFFFGYLLKKNHPHINWIADYRDDWTTNQLSENKTLLKKILQVYNSYFEKKWIKTSTLITSVSNLYVKRLKKLHKKETQLIMNGFKESISNIKPKEAFKNFTIIYSGTVYKKQNFDLFFSALMKFGNNQKESQIKVIFLGSKESLISNSLDKYFINKPGNITLEIMNRISWEENITYLKAADLLFLTSYGNVKGIPTSKLYDYIACQKPILLCPSDEDIMEEIIKKTQTGKSCIQSNDAYLFIQSIFEKKYNYKPNNSVINEFTTKNQVKKMSEIIKNL